MVGPIITELFDYMYPIQNLITIPLWVINVIYTKLSTLNLYWDSFSFVDSSNLLAERALHQFLQRGRTACNAERSISHGNSVCLSVCYMLVP